MAWRPGSLDRIHYYGVLRTLYSVGTFRLGRIREEVFGSLGAIHPPRRKKMQERRGNYTNATLFRERVVEMRFRGVGAHLTQKGARLTLDLP